MTEQFLAQQGYEHYYGMLSDKVRMQAYRDAIFKTVKAGDVVVDLGAGTGLLSIWAIQAGAEKVYAIEKTTAIELAKEIAAANNYLDKIVFLNENSMDVELPERANVLISETLGSFGIDENTLPFTIDARERFLHDDGVMLPKSLEIFVTPVDDEKTYEKIDFWRHIPDINFSPAFDLFSKKIMIESVNHEGLLSSPVSFGIIDLTTVSQSQFQLREYIPITKAGRIHGVAGWFNVVLCEGVEINTSPVHVQTHWKQAFFPLQEPVEVISGDVLDWSVRITAKEINSDDTVIQYEYRCTQLSKESAQTIASYKNIGRNDLCVCGSGKKFKKCCLM